LRREIPILIAGILGLVMLVEYFFVAPTVAVVGEEMQNWAIIVAAFALALAAINLSISHTRAIAAKKPGALNSVLLLASMGFTTVCGIFFGTESAGFSFIFDNIMLPAAAAFYAMACFHVASAAYRAFRAQNAHAAALLVTGVLLMLAKAPIGEYWFPGLPKVTNWIMQVINLAGMRGIMISTAIGFVCVSARILLGIDRSHLGIGQE
jgi:hypothetical protein